MAMFDAEKYLKGNIIYQIRKIVFKPEYMFYNIFFFLQYF